MIVKVIKLVSFLLQIIQLEVVTVHGQMVCMIFLTTIVILKVVLQDLMDQMVFLFSMFQEDMEWAFIPEEEDRNPQR